MQAQRSRQSWLLVGTTFALGALGCAEADLSEGGDEDVVMSPLATVNGLSTANGLGSCGLMNSELGRTQLAYVVRCALPPSASITRQDQYGNNHTFQGLLGMAPQWQHGACDTNCQETVSACLLAHVNTAGIHVPIWVVSQNSAIGWGQDPDFANNEGTFFGNVFVRGAHGTDPTKVPMYYCTGPQFKVSPPAGRIGSAQTNPPYVDPFGPNAACAPVSNCAAADYPHQTDGYKACHGWNNTVSVWRRAANETGTATGTIDTTTHTTTGTVTIPSPRLTTWGIGHGFRNMDH